jgi:hypothetical protein
MRRIAALLMAASLLLLTAVPAAANSDPHRFFLPSGPSDLPVGVCAFPVHLDWPINKEYATQSTLPDGSVVLKVTGKIFMSATNLVSGKTIIVNTSSSGTYTYSSDGTTMIGTFHGPGFLASTNLTSFGFPSNFVVAAGNGRVVVDLVAGLFTSVSGPMHVTTDVCAELS